MKYSIAFYCQSVPFDQSTIRLETSLGGSESALIMMARQLSQNGHDVSVYTRIPQVEDRINDDYGIRWMDVSELMDSQLMLDFDIFISQRFSNIFQYPVQARYKVLWVEDILSQPKPMMADLWQVDEVFYVSEWQRQQYEHFLDDQAQRLGWVTKNVIDPALLPDLDSIQKIPNRLIHISRPERGLKPLLQIFERMRAERPQLELYVSRYHSMYESNPGVAQVIEWADQAVTEADGVHFLGELNKTQLYQEIAQAQLMLYPGVYDFAETSCIAAIETQALATPLVCTSIGALQETVAGGALIKGKAETTEYQDRFIQATNRLLDNPAHYRQAQQLGQAWAQEYLAPTVAAEWEAHFDDFFRQRLEANRPAIARNLIGHDDFQAASVADPEVELPEDGESGQAYAANAADPALEFGTQRHLEMASLVRAHYHQQAEPEPYQVLDLSCGNGSLASLVASQLPAAEVKGTDYSAQLGQVATDFAQERGFPNVTFEQADTIEWCRQRSRSKYDAIICGEFLEHLWEAEAVELINAITDSLKPDGLAVWSVPFGPMHEHLLPSEITMRGHKIEWRPQAIRSVFGQKDGFDFRCIRLRDTPRGNFSGHYLISHGQGPTGQIDFDQKVMTTRPAQRLSVAIITRNNDTDLAKCLNSVQWIADQIVVVDNGSTDNTLQIAESFGAEVHRSEAVWPVALEHGVEVAPGSFAWLRNQSLDQCTGDWVLWIDSDEELKHPHLLHPYLDSTLYDGYVVRQHHLILDAKGGKDHDKPVRLFRNDGQFRFYGCIHEHAQPNINDPIEPALELPDTCIAHYGYTMEADRQAKCKDRNLQLLALDRKLFPERRLGLLLLQRDYLNILKWDAQENGGLTEQGRRASNSIHEIFEREFSDPKDRYYSLSMDILQEMMSITQQGMRYDIIIRPNPDGAHHFSQPSQLENYIYKQATSLVESSFAESADLVHFEGT